MYLSVSMLQAIVSLCYLYQKFSRKWSHNDLQRGALLICSPAIVGARERRGSTAMKYVTMALQRI